MCLLVIAATAAADGEGFGIFSDVGSSTQSSSSSTGTGPVANPWADPAVVSATAAAALTARAAAPLTVTANDHVVVMEYEAWFGPNAMHFEGSAATPHLKSASMAAAGLKGYDSADPLVIASHVRTILGMHADAVELDHSNAVACTYNDDVNTFCKGAADWQKMLRGIRANNQNLFEAYAAAHVPLKIIPLLDGQDDDGFVIAGDGTSAVEKQLRFYKTLIDQHPATAVIYQGHPLIMVYTGTPARPDLITLYQGVLAKTGLISQLTVRYSSGDMESQPNLFAPGPGLAGLNQIKPTQPMWAWFDRFKPAAGLMPTYSANGNVVENFTATIAFPGVDGWGNQATGAVSPTAGLRSAGTFASFMAVAARLRPTFLFVNQFNEFGTGDQGWTADLTSDIEPTDLWGNDAVSLVTAAIAGYRASLTADISGSDGGRAAGDVMIAGGAAVFYSNGEGHFCGYANSASFSEAGKTYANVRTIGAFAPGLINDGACQVQLKGGFFRVGAGTPGVYYSNGSGAFCGVQSPAQLARMKGTADQSDVRVLDGVPPSNRNDGACQ